MCYVQQATKAYTVKVIIAGSRDVNDYTLVVKTIEQSGWKDQITEVVSGCATGIDILGEQWARANNIPIKEMPARWDLYGRKAGPLRNKNMAEYADAAIVIWDGKSAGTRNMIENMIRWKKPYRIGMTSATLEDFV
jgi:hypothetical protein